MVVTEGPSSTGSSSTSSSQEATTTTGSGTPLESPDLKDHKSSGVSGGAIAGIVIGIIAAIIIIAGTLLFLHRRRGPNEAYTNNGGSPSPSFGDPFATRGEDKMAFGPVDDFMAVDQRLNPVMLGERRLSEGSLADDRDYSRKILRVANPDN